jgi:flagellar FliL protein
MLFKKKPKPEAGAEDGAETAAPVDGGEGGDAPPKKKLPILIIAIAGGVLLLGGGGGAAFFLMKPKPAAAEAGHDGGHGAEKKKKKKKEGGHGDKKDDKSAGVVREGPDGVTFYTLPDLIVNMQTPDGRPTFLKLKLTLEMKDEETAELIQEEGPRLNDMFQTFLRELRPEDLSGSQGNYQLRMEILRRVNLVLAPKTVDAVLIEEMLIQ